MSVASVGDGFHLTKKVEFLITVIGHFYICYSQIVNWNNLQAVLSFFTRDEEFLNHNEI